MGTNREQQCQEGGSMRELNRGPMRNIGTAYEPIDPAILALAARYGDNPEAVMPIFQELQTRYGGLSDKIVSDVARSLGIPTAQAQGVASFYAMLSTSMRPPHTIRLCDSPPCWLRGARRHFWEFSLSRRAEYQQPDHRGARSGGQDP
jgi:NADH:ubiquinone oxidoreductase subunit E